MLDKFDFFSANETIEEQNIGVFVTNIGKSHCPKPSKLDYHFVVAVKITFERIDLFSDSQKMLVSISILIVSHSFTSFHPCLRMGDITPLC